MYSMDRQCCNPLETKQFLPFCEPFSRMQGIVFWMMEIIHLPEDNVFDTLDWDLLFDGLGVTPKKF